MSPPSVQQVMAMFVFGVLSLFSIQPATARSPDCPDNSMYANVVYGVPEAGCCHYAKALRRICDPIFSRKRHCVTLGADEIDDGALLGGPKRCARFCRDEESCKIWSFIPEKRVGKETMPSTCVLVAEPLNCKPAACSVDDAVSGRKDCTGQGLAAQDELYDPQRDLASVAADYVDYPICEAPSTKPIVAGYLQAGLLVTNEGCRYPIYDYQGSAQKCVQGSWVVIVGGSNAVLIAAQMANLMTNRRSSIDPGSGMVGSASIVDIVIEATPTDAMSMGFEVGTVVHSNYELFSRSVKWRQIAGRFKGALAKAPAYKPTLTRVTLFVGQFWDNVEDAIDFVRNDPKWGEVPATLVTQISQWYQMGAQGGNWERSDINYRSFSQMYKAYRSHLKAAIKNQLESWCGPNGQAALRGCSLGSNAFTPNQESQVRRVNEIMVEEIEASSLSQTTQLRFVDIWDIGGAAGMAESMEYHSSPVVFAWFWQVNFAQMCPAVKAPPSPNPLLKFTGSCFAGQAKWSLCPECQEMGRCYSLWQCAHAAICDVRAMSYDEVVVSSKSSYSCGSGTVAGRRLAGAGGNTFQATFHASDSAATTEAPCDRVICDSSLQWVPVVVSVVLAVILLSVYIFLQRKAAKDESKEKDGKSVDEEQPKAPAQAEDTNVVNVMPQSENNNPDVANNTVTELQFENSGDGFVNEASKTATAAQEPPKKEEAKPKVEAERFPLGLARFLASMHVVVGHMWQAGATGDVWFYGWGFTWVPWFFMLSGFVLFHSEARKPTKEFNIKEQLKYFAKRTVAIYPLYAFVLPFAWIINWDRDAVPGAGYILSQIWLVQSWVPSLTEWVFPYMTHCWFLSCMVIYWMLFQPLAWMVNRMGLATVSILTFSLCLLPWLMLIVPAAAGDVNWYTEHSWKGREDAVDHWVVFFKFHPVCYFHVFVLGMLIQKWRLLAGERPGLCKCLRWPMEALAPLAYLILCLLFAIKEITIDDGSSTWGHKLTARLSVLLPLQAAILLGLAGVPKNPMPLIAKAALWLEPLADYSYGVYICHMLCYAVWPSDGPVNGWYFVFVVATAVVLVLTVQKPIQPWWRANPGKTIIIPLVLTLILPLLTLIDSPEQQSSAAHILPESRTLEPGVQDVRLPFANAGEGGDLMNPSIMVVNDQMVAVARRHSRSFEQSIGEYEGKPATIIDAVWNSQIVFGTGKLQVDRRLVEAAGKGSSLEKWANGATPRQQLQMKVWTGLQTPEGKPWSDLCVKKTWIPENSTLMRVVRTGPEDPKILDFGDSMAIAFSSLPPLGANGCGPDKELGTVHQMYLAAGLDLTKPAKAVTGNRMTCGWRKLDEKNWIPFTKDGNLNFVYSPQPHLIMVSRDDGQCAEAYRTNFLPLQKLTQENKNLKVRGNAQAVYVNDPKATTQLPIPHYLAIMHIYDTLTGRYAHYAYRFSVNPPFEILQISEELPLSALKPSNGGTAMAFVSGLAVDGRAVMISYGAGDRDARALVMTLEKLDALFPCCNEPCVPGSFHRTVTVGHWGKHQRGDFGYSHGQECIMGNQSQGTLTNSMTQSSKLSVMCCDVEQERKRICDLCDGGEVLEDEIAGSGCYAGDKKIGGNCADDDMDACRQQGGDEIRDYTCKEVQDYLTKTPLACKNGALKMHFGAKCCAGGVDAVTRRRQTSGNKKRGKRRLLTTASTSKKMASGKKRLLTTGLPGNMSATQLHDAIMSNGTTFDLQERRLQNGGCNLCELGTLNRNAVAGHDGEREYTCFEAQQYLHRIRDERHCNEMIGHWEKPCCVNAYASGCRTAADRSDDPRCYSHEECFQSADCYRDNSEPHGCSEGKCYAGRYDERCDDKRDGHQLGDGGWCWEGRRDYECQRAGYGEGGKEEDNRFGPQAAKAGVYILELFDPERQSCEETPLATIGFDFSKEACIEYPFPEKHPLNGKYAKLLGCSDGDGIEVHHGCNKGCSECEVIEKYTAGQCAKMSDVFFKLAGGEEGAGLYNTMKTIHCPCSSMCSRPGFELNLTAIAGEDAGKDYTCEAATSQLEDSKMDDDPYAICDVKKDNSWEDKCCYKPAIARGEIKLQAFGTKSDCVGEPDAKFSLIFHGEDCVEYPRVEALREYWGYYAKLTACNEGKSVTIEHVCEEGCKKCMASETYKSDGCDPSDEMTIKLADMRCPCTDFCPAGTHYQGDAIIKENDKEFSCDRGMGHVQQDQTNEKCRNTAHWQEFCCKSNGTAPTPAPTPAPTRGSATDDGSDRRLHSRLLKGFVPPRKPTLKDFIDRKVAKGIAKNARRTSDVCQEGATFEAAEAHCENLGHELCTSDLIKEGWGLGQCPASDSALVWTADPCVPGATYPKKEVKEW